MDEQISTNTYSSTNVSTSAYVTLTASSNASYAHLLIVDTSTQLMKLAIGVAGSEVDFCVFQGNGYPVVIPVSIAPGSRIAVKAISSTASTGYLAVSYLR